ncbi:hypothetical protein DL98DRAFT_592849 [Cadophora sp. DSE1049]|nr:hypothetical protein DL98DRAFT_592849 [Cadophora sp. DSE1049]
MQDSVEITADAALSMNDNTAITSPTHPPSASSPSSVAEPNTEKAPASHPTTSLKNNDAEYEITSPGAEALKTETTSANTKTAEDKSILQLLHIAQTSGFAPIAIPGNLLASLLTSMSNLQTQVSTRSAPP